MKLQLQENTTWIFVLLFLGVRAAFLQLSRFPGGAPTELTALAAVGFLQLYSRSAPAGARASGFCPAGVVDTDVLGRHGGVRDEFEARCAWWGDQQRDRCSVGAAVHAGSQGHVEVVSHV